MSLDVDLDHADGGFALRTRFRAGGHVTALFGRSGAGKTSLLHFIAGLRRPRRGRVAVGDRVLVDTEAGVWLAPHRRRIGYVFQEGRLLPHLSVRRNLGYGRWFTRAATRRADWTAIVDLLGIAALLDRRPANLSGGERQRVAIGRALLADPDLLLLDEPLAALDEARKGELLGFIERLVAETRLPIVYVSHALDEVARLADALVILAEGRVAAAGPLGDLLARTDLAPWLGADAIGSLLDARVAGDHAADGLTRLDTAAGPLLVPRLDRPVGAALRVRVPARDVFIALTRPVGFSAQNLLPALIETLEPDGATTVMLRLRCGDAPLLARVTRRAVDQLGLAPGLAVYAVIKSVALGRATA